MTYRRFRPWMLNGRPGNVTWKVKRAIVRAVNAGCVVTATTNGAHATTSWHYPSGLRRKGKAVDIGVRNPASAPQRRRLLAFQRAEYQRGLGRGVRELFGPINNRCLKNGQRMMMAEHSTLEDQHDNHVHLAP